MSWVPNKRRLALFALLVGVAGEFSVAAAQVLVLRATGPSRQYRSGQRLPNSAQLRLRPGDEVVILTRGGTRRFRGPGLFAATGPLRAGTFAQRSPNRIVQTGAVRLEEMAASLGRPSDIWQYNVSGTDEALTGRRACVLQGNRPVLFREDVSRSVRLTITPTLGTPQSIEWRAGQATLAWPAQLPVSDGASYQLSWTGGTPIRLTTEIVPPVAGDNLDALATAFIDNQCLTQLNTLIALRAEDGTPR